MNKEEKDLVEREVEFATTLGHQTPAERALVLVYLQSQRYKEALEKISEVGAAKELVCWQDEALRLRDIAREALKE